MFARRLLALGFAVSIAPAIEAADDPAVRPAAGLPRALAYLEREVPRWSRENRCFSCHNNADGARALYLAAGPGPLPAPLRDSHGWLVDPKRWEHNGGEGPFSDKRLARLQFAAALADAVATGKATDRGPLLEVARAIVADQRPDGSWAPEGPEALGSPATLGTPLATLTARDILRAADPRRFADAIARAQARLDAITPVTLIDAAVVLQARDDHPRAADALERIREGEADGGGWGPYADSPPEPFDTAVVLLALARDRSKHREMIERGRRYLIAAQLDDGSWPETTRPAGLESYAQRVSTAGWAARALIATAPAVTDSTPKPDQSPRGVNGK
ncbi:MAG: hypothetical protein SFX72_23265 [Isosphaeraceae bacterium]|nr:hypothetical protein [Isosphaeraceae bacterium]